MGNSVTTVYATGHSGDDYLSYASVANMKVTGTWGNAEIVVQPSPAVIKSKPESGEAVGLLKLDKSTHLKVLDYIKPDLAVGALLQGRKERNIRGGKGGGVPALSCTV
jgi:hypothetical protein